MNNWGATRVNETINSPTCNNFFPRNELDLFSNPAANMMESRDHIRKGSSFFLLRKISMICVATWCNLKAVKKLCFLMLLHTELNLVTNFCLRSPKPIDLYCADWFVFSPGTPGPWEDVWPARQNSSNYGSFDISPAKKRAIPVDAMNRRAGDHSVFGAFAAAANPSITLRNSIPSPMKRPPLSRNRSQMLT